LLPRPIPSEFTRTEVEEFERRIRNLSLFDRVQVATHDGNLAVDVQEKFSLSPILSFTSGTSVKDLNATTERGCVDLGTRIPTRPLGERSEGLL
jgi:hypothetical protein